MKKALCVLVALLVSTLPAIAGDITALNIGTNMKTTWVIAPKGSLSDAQPRMGAAASGLYAKKSIAVSAEFGVAEGQGNLIGGLWAGYLYDDWILAGAGVDSRFLFEQAGIGPSASLAFLVPLTDGSTGRLEVRYSWFGNDADGGAQLSLGFGLLNNL